jgi:hypothetical protein
MMHTVDDILNKLDNCIQYKLPFSHIRFGDGGIKFLHGIIYNDDVNVAKSTKQYIRKFTDDIISNLIASRIDFIDLQPLLINSIPLKDLYFFNGTIPAHFTPEGNRFVAEILGQRVRDIINLKD